MTSQSETVLAAAVLRLEQAAVDTPLLDARLLLAHVMGIEPGQLRFCRRELSFEEQQVFHKMLDRRLNREPVDKIIGRRGFYKYEFRTTGAVLSPRPDTETLVESVLEYTRGKSELKILDLGIGSGCILLSLLAEKQQATGWGVDASAEALEIAALNAYDLQVGDRLKLLNGSWFEEDLCERLGYGFDVVVSNPPYIPTEDITGLEPEVRNFDPLLALDGGQDGFRDYRRLAQIVPALLLPGGLAFIEAGVGQASDIVEIFRDSGLSPLERRRDLGGIERCVILKK